MTIQIVNMLKETLHTNDVAVIIEADHMCVAMRGVQDASSSTITSDFSGKFQDAKTREELMKLISLEIK
jgi:GTP cyclohydrolase I